MKTNTSTLRALALFSLVATLGPVAVMAQGPVNFTVPFEFTVGTTSFNAGDYQVSTVVPGVLRIRSWDGHAGMMVMTQNGDPAKQAGPPVLTFRRYGDQYFLSRMADSSRGWELPKSPGEKEIAARATLTAVIASAHR